MWSCLSRRRHTVARYLSSALASIWSSACSSRMQRWPMVDCTPQEELMRYSLLLPRFLPLLLFVLAPLRHVVSQPQVPSHIVRSVFPSFRTFPCPAPPSTAWSRPAAAAVLDWSRAPAGTAVVVTFDEHYLATFEASTGEVAVIALPPDKLLPGCGPICLLYALTHRCCLTFIAVNTSLS